MWRPRSLGSRAIPCSNWAQFCRTCYQGFHFHNNSEGAPQGFFRIFMWRFPWNCCKHVVFKDLVPWFEPPLWRRGTRSLKTTERGEAVSHEVWWLFNLFLSLREWFGCVSLLYVADGALGSVSAGTNPQVTCAFPRAVDDCFLWRSCVRHFK